MALALAIASPPTPAAAWNSFGHMAVAYVAYQGLTPATRTRVLQLLALHPKYAEWRRRLPGAATDAEKDRMVFMVAATWADQIKADPSYVADGSDHGNRPEGSPDPRRNTGYGDKLMHKYWHFVDVPFTRDATHLPSIPSPNAETQIAAFRRVLAASADDGLVSYDVSWLLHLVGDVHQPLHCATRVSRGELEGDRGGNAEEVKTCNACALERLHAFWDAVLGTGEDPEAVIPFAKALPRPDDRAARNLDAAAWIAESFREAQRDAYVRPVEAGDGPFTLTSQYQAHARQLAEERIAVAGARLANLLNAELKR